MICQLLVSVRNVDECRQALHGGADIIDVKEPRHGSLGRAAWSTIEQIASLLGHQQDPPRENSAPHYPPLSVALGEWDEWTGSHLPNCPDEPTSPSPPAFHIDGARMYFKLGTAGLTNTADTQRLALWQRSLETARFHLAN
ncbi:MAG: hypothetical protein KDA85_10555, partial [Planctomycetaceae bacterium]|nr:hypothetical protein [Planctomycetaceae bacterium]